MKFLLVLLLTTLSAGNAVAQLYVTNDDLAKHHLCLKNPYDSYMTGDQNTAFPNCYTNYAVIHIPTYNAEISGSQATIKLDPTLDVELALWGFGLGAFFWGIGQFGQLILSVIRKIRL